MSTYLLYLHNYIHTHRNEKEKPEFKNGNFVQITHTLTLGTGLFNARGFIVGWFHNFPFHLAIVKRRMHAQKMAVWIQINSGPTWLFAPHALFQVVHFRLLYERRFWFLFSPSISVSGYLRHIIKRRENSPSSKPVYLVQVRTTHTVRCTNTHTHIPNSIWRRLTRRSMAFWLILFLLLLHLNESYAIDKKIEMAAVWAASPNHTMKLIAFCTMSANYWHYGPDQPTRKSLMKILIFVTLFDVQCGGTTMENTTKISWSSFLFLRISHDKTVTKKKYWQKTTIRN